MCELFGMSANTPTDACFSFKGLMKRGGETGPHRDGWGIGFYDRKRVQTFHDAAPSATSPIANLIANHAIKSEIVISHIRQANSGQVNLENTHPFVRELWGRHWTFAHNGQLKGMKRRHEGRYSPVGTTDSEHAFCTILNTVFERYPKAPKSGGGLWRLIHDECEKMRQKGVFNLIMSDSKYLYVYCSTQLHYLTRRAPFGVAELQDVDLSVNFQALTQPEDVVTVIATRPLTENEVWTSIPVGTLLVFKDGLVERRYSAVA